MAIYACISMEVEPISTYLRARAKWFYCPSSHVSCDESLLAFKGRYRFRQHIRGKPHATGLKVERRESEKERGKKKEI
jgi:hypothetical protein